MKKNMGNADRIIRLVLAAVVAVLYFTNTITGTFGIILLVLAGIFVITSLVSFCPLYTLVGLNTCPAKKN
jgi:fatty acid desaturase